VASWQQSMCETPSSSADTSLMRTTAASPSWPHPWGPPTDESSREPAKARIGGEDGKHEHRLRGPAAAKEPRWRSHCRPSRIVVAATAVSDLSLGEGVGSLKGLTEGRDRESSPENPMAAVGDPCRRSRCHPHHESPPPPVKLKGGWVELNRG
jgi:hypothetical protein